MVQLLSYYYVINFSAPSSCQGRDRKLQMTFSGKRSGNCLQLAEWMSQAVTWHRGAALGETGDTGGRGSEGGGNIIVTVRL